MNPISVAWSDLQWLNGSVGDALHIGVADLVRCGVGKGPQLLALGPQLIDGEKPQFGR